LKWREELKEKAKRSLNKRPPYGPDVNLGVFLWDKGGKAYRNLSTLPQPILERAKVTGIDVKEERVGGTYFQLDFDVLRAKLAKDFKRAGVYLMSVEEALTEFEWARNYYWKALPVDTDKYTAITELKGSHGYFIYVPPKVKVSKPLQTCLFIHKDSVAQAIHNIVIVDEGGELNLLTACSALPVKALHIGITEFYVKRNAKLTFTMVHFWSPTLHVRPRAVALVEEGGYFLNYYIHMAPVKSLQTFPTAKLIGEGAQAYLTSILLASKDAYLDVGGGIEFKANNTKGEVISRSVIRDEANVILRGELVGSSTSKGHIDCKGLLLSERARGEAIPILKSSTGLAELTHEAALGKISHEELEYLMSKGFSEDEAISLVVRGFLETGLEKLPPNLRGYADRILDLISKYARG